jgi:hypothetical protein
VNVWDHDPPTRSSNLTAAAVVGGDLRQVNATDGYLAAAIERHPAILSLRQQFGNRARQSLERRLPAGRRP